MVRCVRRLLCLAAVFVSGCMGGQSGELETGLVQMPWGVEEISFERHEDGLLHHGDVLLDPKDVLSEGTGDIRFASAEASEKTVWSQGVIPYTFADDVSDQARKQIEGRVRHWNKLGTPVFLTEWYQDTRDYVEFYQCPEREIGGAAPLGRKKGKNRICLNNIMKSFEHELLHSLGFIHEHVRPDRDRYVEIDWDVVAEKKDAGVRDGHKKYRNMPIEELSPYDYTSVMHYRDRNVFSAKGDYNGRIGSNNHVSKNDLVGINKRYPNLDFSTECHDNRDAFYSSCTDLVGSQETEYYTWALGSYWTCSQMWADGTAPAKNLWGQELKACDGLVKACVDRTYERCYGDK